MTRLIVISNRVSSIAKAPQGAQGGLAVALAAALRKRGGIWFGWSGEETPEYSGQITFSRCDGFTSATVDLEAQDIDEYYDGYANRTLWPLFHYRVDLAEFRRGFAEGYLRTNSRLARTVLPLIDQDDAIWVQDYHLIPFAAELRRQGCRNRIGFFLHIPWPPRRLLTTLPEAVELVQSLLAYDVIGFQANEWLQSFCDFATQELGAELGEDGRLSLDGRCVRLLNCPIGIDVDEFAAMATLPEAHAAQRQMLDSAADRAMILGVDRLDYSKGLEERFLGYERFLMEHPAIRKRVFLLQIAPPSRVSVESYQRIRTSLEGHAGRINGEHADLDWVPIRYVNQGYARGVLAGVYRAARIGLVTPLRDGMNLVAKEYVAAQDPADPGVLILSRFAGAAEQLESALLVNPHSAEELSDAILTALEMPLDERIERWTAMMDVLRAQDIGWWRMRFEAALADAAEGQSAVPTPTVAAEPECPLPAIVI